MIININEYVRIRLTDLGREILKTNNKEHLCSKEVNGWTEWKLWVLIDTFGDRINPEFYQPFEPNIQIPEVQ